MGMVERVPRRLRNSPEFVKRAHFEYCLGGNNSENAKKCLALNEIVLRCNYDGLNRKKIYDIIGKEHRGIFELTELDNFSFKEIRRLAEMLDIYLDDIFDS